MTSNGFELSAEKTVLMVFTRDVQSRGDFWARIGGNVVQQSKQAKFLGVTITQSLSWMLHIRSLITKARRATSMIKLLKGETWVTPRSLVHLTRALVRSRLTMRHLSPPQTLCDWTLNELSWRLSRQPLSCRDMPSMISLPGSGMAALTRGKSPQVCPLRGPCLHSAKHSQGSPRNGLCPCPLHSKGQTGPKTP